MAKALIIGWIAIGLVLAEGAVAAGAPKRLPEIQYPTATSTLLAGDLNPQATDAMARIHALSGVPDGHAAIRMPAAGRPDPLAHYLASLITKRGGAAAVRCGRRGPEEGTHRCVVWAAMPQSIADQLGGLSDASPVDVQTFIEQESERTGWAHDATDQLRIAEIHLTVPRGRTILFETDYRHVRDYGFLLLIFGGVLAVAAAGVTYQAIWEAI